MDGMFSLLRSKKASEAGVWETDEEIINCPLCNSPFNLLVRKHHCRKCGKIVCGGCSDNRVFLESSRSGALKRVCDTCVAADKRLPDEEEEEEADRETERARKAMGKASLSGASATAPAPRGGGAGGKAGGAGAAGGKAPSSSSPSSSTDVSVEEATEALKSVTWAGKWRFNLVFYAVDIGKSPAGMNADAAASFKGLPGVKGSGGGGGGSVKVGSKVPLAATLRPKGAAYFQGEVAEFGQFGKDGKVTGALQRSTGKVNMTLQIVSTVTRVTTSFNFVGACNKSGTFVGNFSGCEISKTAGTVSGVFSAEALPAEEGGEDGDRAAKKGKGGGGSSEEEGEEDVKPKAKAGGKAPAKAKPKRKASSDSDSD